MNIFSTLKLSLGLCLALVLCILPVNGQGDAVQITAGSIVMKRGVQNLSNASLVTSQFSAVSWFNDVDLSGWNVCSLSSIQGFCKAGTNFSVPAFEWVEIGYCGACSPPQFPKGTVVINGNTYQNAYFSGQFRFPPVNFSVSPAFLAKRKGSVRFRKPFSMSAKLEICKTEIGTGCRPENVLFSGDVKGHGTLVVTARIVTETEISPRPFLSRDSIEYTFEP